MEEQIITATHGYCMDIDTSYRNCCVWAHRIIVKAYVSSSALGCLIKIFLHLSTIDPLACMIPYEAKELKTSRSPTMEWRTALEGHSGSAATQKLFY